MKKQFITLITIAFMTASCHNSTKLTSGIDLSNLDTTTVPGTDFYQYACGGWMKNHPLTGEYSRFGSFDLLEENNRLQLRELIEGIASKSSKEGTVEQKIGDLFNLAMDSIKLNKDGFQPVMQHLDLVNGIKSKEQISLVLPQLMISGISPFFSLFVDADQMNSNKYLLQTYQGGISLGEREYYLDTDSQTTNIRNKYKEHVVKMFRLFGFTAEKAEANMQAVLNIETRLATAAFDQVKLREPLTNYHKISLTEIQKLTPEIHWDVILKALGISFITDLNVSQKKL